MSTADRTVLHVLPHPGGGGETYVDLLEAMPGYRFDRMYLAGSPTTSPLQAFRGAVRTNLLGRRFDLVHSQGEVAAGLGLPLLATRRSVVTLHGLHLARRLHGIRRRAAVTSLRAVLRAADRTICVSETEHAELTRIVGHAATERAVVIRNGVRIPPPSTADERAVVRDELGIPADDIVGIWIGSLDERKDPLTAVHAAKRANVTLLVVGDGPLRSLVEQAASRRAHVLGQRADVHRLLGASDFYVLTSHREGLALSLLEGMARGLPLIVTDLPENVEAIGDTGLPVPVGDARALETALRRLAENGAQRAAFAEKSVRRAADLFAVERMLDQTRALYDEVLSGP